MTSTPGEARLTRVQRAAVALGPWLVRMLAATWRVRTVNEDGWRALRADRRGFVFSLWHGEMLPLLAHHHDQGVKVLISEHRDGEVIARIAQRLGFGTIRGSTTRGATRALLAMVDELRRGNEIAVTPDGPRGPRRTFASGAVVAAQRAGVPIVAVGAAVDRAWRLGSWDAFVIPKPFSRIVVAYGDPVCVQAPDARSAADEAPRFEREMATAVARAEALLRERA
jgi:lysophospholipid acyltransferase (LPLAT)-like uncharacterized protein